jgi:hypothetical protein
MSHRLLPSFIPVCPKVDHQPGTDFRQSPTDKARSSLRDHRRSQSRDQGDTWISPRCPNRLRAVRRKASRRWFRIRRLRCEGRCGGRRPSRHRDRHGGAVSGVPSWKPPDAQSDRCAILGKQAAPKTAQTVNEHGESAPALCGRDGRCRAAPSSVLVAGRARDHRTVRVSDVDGRRVGR